MSNTNNTYDVVVVGAGVFGAWTSYQLQRAGMRVILIDAHGAGNSLSSSGGESRIIRMGYGADEIYTRSAQRALRLWQELFEQINEPLFHKTGVLWLAHEADPYPEKCAETLTKLAIPFERLTISEVGDRYPQFELERISWALFEPDSGVLLARQAVQAVTREVIRNGAEYLQAEVKRPRRQTETGPYRNCEWPPHLGRALRFRLWPLAAENFSRLVGRQNSFDPSGSRFLWHCRW